MFERFLYMRAFMLSLQWSPTLCDPMDCRLLCSWDSPDKNIGVDFHALFQGGLLDPEIKPRCPATSALLADSLSPSHWRSPLYEYLLQIQSLLSDYCRIGEYACLSTKHEATGLIFAPTASVCQPNRLLVCYCCLVAELCPVLCIPDGSVIKNPPANTGNVGLIPGSQRSPRERNGNPHQSPCLGNPMEIGA